MRPFRPSSIFSRVMCTALAVLHLLVFSTAQAQVPVVPTGGNGNIDSFLSEMIAGNRNITRNNQGAASIDLPPGQTSDTIYSLFKGDSIVWARWYRLAGVGSIQVVKAVWTTQLNAAGGHIHLQVINYDPETASKIYADFKNNGIKEYYGGVDPFAPFKAGNGMWNKTGRNEFYTAVGQAAIHYGIRKAYVAVALQRDDMKTWDSCIVKALGACLKRRYYQELKTYIKPTWSVGTTGDVGRGRVYTTAFKVAGCTLATQSCVMYSGLGFADVATESDFPQEESLASDIEHHNDGWTGLAFALMFATIAVIAAPLLMDAPGLLAAAVNSASVGAVESVAAAYTLDALGYAAISLASGGSLSDAQDGFFGNLEAVPVAGQFSEKDIKPEWDMRPQVINSWLAKPMEQVGGGVGVLMNAKPVDTSGATENTFWEQRLQGPMRVGGLPVTQ